MKRLLSNIFIILILVLLVITNSDAQRRSDANFTIDELTCPDNLVRNSNFTKGSKGNISSTTVPNWKPANKDPIYDNGKGHYDKGYVSMWGNQVVGEALYQQLDKPLKAGKKYRIAFSVQAKQINKRPNYARVKLRASNGVPRSPTCSSENCTMIGISKKIYVDEGWKRVEFLEWRAPKNFQNIIISIENEFNENNGEKTSTAWIDNICIEEIKESADDLPPQLLSPYENEMVNTKLEKKLQFRWSGPVENVNYQINIFELNQKDTVISTAKLDKPLFREKVNGKNSFTLPVNQIRFRNNQSYIWNVQALNKKGEPICADGCYSTPRVFTVLQVDCGLDLFDLQITCTPNAYQNGQIKYNGCVSVLNTSNSSSLSFSNTGSGLILYDNSVNPVPISGLVLTTGLPSSLSPNTSATVCFDISVPMSLSAVNIQLIADDVDPSALGECIAKDFATAPLPICICDDCTTVVNIRGAQSIDLTAANHPDYDVLNIKSGIMASTSVIKMSTEIVYFKLDFSDNLCKQCVKYFRSFATFDANPSFNFIKNHPSNPNATSGFTNVKGTFIGAYDPSISKMLEWESKNGGGVDLSNGPINFDLHVGVPKVNKLSCCATTMSICIRYTLTDNNCRVCDYLLCNTRTFNGNSGGGNSGNGSGSGSSSRVRN